MHRYILKALGNYRTHNPIMPISKSIKYQTPVISNTFFQVFTN